MKVLVTGGTGLLGWWLAKVFHDKGFKVYASYCSKQPIGLEDVEWIKLI